MMNDERPRLRRADVPGYLLKKHGLPISPKTLAKMASAGGGPAIAYWGRIPLYNLEDLDSWAAERLKPPVRSTAERGVA